jgi:twitching motility protein PilT
VERFVGAFSAAEQSAVRERLGRMLRCVISQRLIPRKSDEGRVALFEVLKAGSSVLSSLLENGTANSAEIDTSHELGFDIQIEKLVRAGIVSSEIALTYATNAPALSRKLAASAK